MKLKARNLNGKKNGEGFDPEERIGALIKSGLLLLLAATLSLHPLKKDF